MKTTVLISLISLSFASFGSVDNEDYLSEQAWKTVRKAKWTRTIVEKKSGSRAPAKTDFSDIEWFEKMEKDFQNETDFDLPSSFDQVDELI